MSDNDSTQNQRLRDLEMRTNNLENQLNLLLGKIESLTQIGKILALSLAAVIGIDVVPMM